MKHSAIATFYDPRQVHVVHDSDESRSPEKPKLLIEFLKKNNVFENNFELFGYQPFEKADFQVAHTAEYVNGFFAGEEPYASNHGVLGIAWSKKFASSLTFTNASLYNAILHSIKSPERVAFSPTSGFHHATPEGGALFCAFSGQVIASAKLYRQFGVSGVWIDLDGHFGNSIEDSRQFVPDLDDAVPPGLNINLRSKHTTYLENLQILLGLAREQIIAGKVHYVVFCHGADSHEDDDIGHQLTTEEWIECSRMVYNWVAEIEATTNKPLPLSLSLFGGYRKSNFESVLALHAADLMECLRILCNKSEIDVDTLLKQVTPASSPRFSHP